MMDIDFDWNRQTIVCIGASECGKTKFVQEVLVKNVPRLIALDSNFEYSTKFKLKPVTDTKDIAPNTAFQTVDFSTKTLNEFIISCRQYTNCLIIYEDIDLFLEGAAPQEIKNIQINGRHQRFGQIAISKRLIGLPILLLQRAHYLVIWKIPATLQHRDLDMFKKAIPSIELHKKIAQHDKIIYKMDSDIARPLFYDKCQCENCKKERAQIRGVKQE